MAPYIYKEYPRRLHKYGGAVVTVDNDEDKAAKLAEGWSLVPVLEAPIVINDDPEVVSPAAPSEAGADAGDAPPPRRRGRPRKDVT